jgi:hypothetical protein
VNALDWLKSHKPEAALGGGGIVVALVLYERSKSNSSGGSAATTQSYADPATTADTTGSDAYSGIENQVLGLQQAFLASSTAAAPTTPAAPAAAAGPFTGFGTESFGGKSYDELGNVTNGIFNGYNVGGDEPVFYDVNGSLETNLSSAAIAGLPAGTDVLTVAQAGQQNQISTTPVSGQKI